MARPQDGSSESSTTPPARSLDLERLDMPYLHRPESVKSSSSLQRRTTGGPQSPIFSASSSSLPPQDKRDSRGSLEGRTGYSISGPRASMDISSRRIRDTSHPIRRDSAVSVGTVSSVASARAPVPQINSEVDLSIVSRKLPQEDDFDEEEDILEFRLNNANSGIIKYRDSTEDGVPELVRYSTSSRNKNGSKPDLRENLDEICTTNSGSFEGLEDPSSIVQPVGKSTAAESETVQTQQVSEAMFSQSLDPHNAQTRDPTLPSEFSHQSALISEFAHLNEPHESKVGDGLSEDEESGWQDMKIIGSYEVYDDKGQVVVHKSADFDNEVDPQATLTRETLGHASAATGYTRVAMDDDAKSVNSMDENTDFLFGEDDLERNPLSQLQATKDMLTDSQKIAYIGLCRLVMNGMAVDLLQLKGARQVATALTNSHESMAMWGQKMMIRLYAHMDIGPEGKSVAW
ncbi:hypothetical protein AWJ20_5006 [Sugiyamaella lignohabitans]|uniref:Uncharacterized protein n=1 Tax=Sugiyamaella lignohabitans TaxID=796027 RepID=A0A161HF39_9ASCO|nr:uncharacterized protein AWJ20_5006 [Sugiyamaella lignohabitans]ANB14050.1 hypothetical protein AWJ20_5006 [Sugiyamaella lignohabitans]